MSSSADVAKLLLGPKAKPSHVALVTRIAKQTPLSHLLIYSRRGKHKGAVAIISLILLAGLIVGIVLCNNYGLQSLSRHEASSQHNATKALNRRFGLGIGTGIFAGLLGGSLGLGIIGLVILFVLGKQTPLFPLDEHNVANLVGAHRGNGKAHLDLRPVNNRLVRHRYYLGLAAGGILGVMGNIVLMGGLARERKA